MGLKNRYFFLKRTYPKTIILFLKNAKYKSYGLDNNFLTFLHFKNLSTLNKLKINYLVLQNMEILNHQIFSHNMYDIYYKRYQFIKIITIIHNRLY